MKKLILFMTIPALMVACGGEDKKDKKDEKKELSKEDQCRCLDGQAVDKSKECVQYRASVIKQIKKDIGVEGTDITLEEQDQIEAKLNELRADCK